MFSTQLHSQLIHTESFNIYGHTLYEIIILMLLEIYINICVIIIFY